MFLLTVESGEVRLNGQKIERADLGKKWARAKSAFYPPGTDTSAIETLMKPPDVAWVGRGGDSPSFTFKVHRDGQFRIAPFSSWGVDEEHPRRGLDAIEELRTAAGILRGGAGRTLGSTAGKVCKQEAERDHLGQLQPQFRTLAHSAIHQGPTVVLRGGCDDGIEIDRVAAFLQGMRRPVPVNWIAWPDVTWAELEGIEDEGIARAAVYLDPGAWAGRLPPLPVRTSGGTIYPVGLVAGVWTLGLLRQAVSLGAVVLELEEVALAACENVHARAADVIDAVPHKGLRKLLYTRYWGRLAAVGGFDGSPEQREETDVRINHSLLWWRWSGMTVGKDGAPDYRPDQAAFIATSNHLEMNARIATIPPDGLIAAHVDALWIDGSIHEPGEPGGWKEKARGPLRWYATGTYSHDDQGNLGDKGIPARKPGGLEHHAQGCKAKPLTTKRMNEWTGGLRKTGDWIRRWGVLGGPSQTDPGATSDPPVHGENHRTYRPESIPSVSDPDAWISGWPSTPELADRLKTLSILDVW